MVKGFLVVNTISLAMFIATITLILKAKDTVEIVFAVIFGLTWVAYTLIANVILVKNLQVSTKLKDSDHHNVFKGYVDKLNRQYESIKSREEFFMTKTSESMQDIYKQILEQMKSNIDSATAYIMSYDYYTKPKPTYLVKIVSEGDILIAQFNTLVEKIVDIDTNLTELDTHYVDDVVASLEEMRKMK